MSILPYSEAQDGWRPMTEAPPADIPHGVALVFAHFDTVQLSARTVDPLTWAQDPANVMLDNAGAYAWTLLGLPPNAVDEWMRECTPALREKHVRQALPILQEADHA